MTASRRRKPESLKAGDNLIIPPNEKEQKVIDAKIKELESATKTCVQVIAITGGGQLYLVGNAQGEQIYVGITGSRENAARNAVVRLKERLATQREEWLDSPSNLEIVVEGFLSGRRLP